MANKILIDPVTRIEGHLKVEIEVDQGAVIDAKCTGSLFRGFELIMKGREPKDAQQLTQRICGVCPQSHGLAASLSLEKAFGVEPPENARILRNLMQGINYVMSHILHFYQLAALDYVKGPDTPPFIPRYNGDYRLPKNINDAAVNHYVQALDIRKKCHEMLAIFGGKMPHSMTSVPGGVTEKASVDKIVSFQWRLKEISYFVDNVYIPDVMAIAKIYEDYFKIGAGCKNFLSFGVFPQDKAHKSKLLKQGTYLNGQDSDMDAAQITEQVKHSWYKSETTGKNPTQGFTSPQVDKKDAYSFVKAPRYNGLPCEVGPLARMWINGDYRKGISVMDRIAARALECQKVVHALEEWILQLKPNEKTCTSFDPSAKCEGAGLTEAPRGSLGHWIKVVDSKTENYQIIPATNWNCSPRDDANIRGPLETALIGTPISDIKHPIEAARVIRSYDP
ncbi:MAG: nickel-dependent hydrogenase large subunit [Desulfobacterales bacterium]|nr:nickel-dependent hydrogenase large subunit [Desulfobacterales bacterium]